MKGEKLASFVAKRYAAILVCAVLIFALSLSLINHTFVNYDLLSYLPENLNSVEGEAILDEVFSVAGSAFLISENAQPKDVIKIKERISQIHGVSRVIWVDDISDISIPVSMLPDEVCDIFYSSDKSSTLLFIQFSGSAASVQTAQAIKEIEKAVGKNGFLSGMSAMMSQTKDELLKEMPLYIALSGALAFAVLSFSLRNFSVSLIILVCAGLAAVCNMGTNFIFPSGISYITQSIAVVLQLAVTMDYSVFLADRYREELQKGAPATQACKVAVCAALSSLSTSALTTVCGFAALCFMSFSLGFDLGAVMSKGVLLGLLYSLTVLPSLLVVFCKKPKAEPVEFTQVLFKKFINCCVRHRKRTVTIFVSLIIPALALQSFVKPNYDITAAMPSDIPSLAAAEKLKNDFGMSSTTFVITDASMPDGKTARMIEEAQSIDGVSSVIAVNSFVGPAFSEDMLPAAIKEICIRGGYELMAVNSVFSASSAEQNALLDSLYETVSAYDPNAFITGDSALSKDLAAVTHKDFAVTGIIGTTAVFIVLAIFFKSLPLAGMLVLCVKLASMLNDSVSLLFPDGISFIVPTVVSSIQLGATVDYAILLSSRFREESAKGLTPAESAVNAARLAAGPILQSAAVFISASLAVYFTGNISIIKDVCLLLASGCAISAAAVICLLPSLFAVYHEFILKRKDKIRHG
ncbi:MAG: MMPL family transporter [Clostridia bacterium]|nr:MMPL family transporter [Clostridia bacterium]